MSATTTTPNQFLRSFKLLVANSPVEGFSSSVGTQIDESLRCTFEIFANDVETPNHAVITIYNLFEDTQNKIINEYDTVILQAGYRNGNFGVIFKGTIKQFKRGRERNVDNYLRILAADGDLAYNFGVINQTFNAGSSPQQQLAAAAASANIPVDQNANNFLVGGVILSPRSKAAFGLMRNYMRDLADTYNCRWSIQNGVLTLIPMNGYLPGAAVQINSGTGMIGVPEATDDGIHVTTLLNPLIKVGYLVQINNADIAQSTPERFGLSFTRPPVPLATTTNDGFYRVLVVEHHGDTRGQDWYTELTCISLTAPGGIVLPAG